MTALSDCFPTVTVLALAAPKTAPFRGSPLCSLAYGWRHPKKFLLSPESFGRHRNCTESREIDSFITSWINPSKNDTYPGLEWKSLNPDARVGLACLELEK